MSPVAPPTAPPRTLLSWLHARKQPLLVGLILMLAVCGLLGVGIFWGESEAAFYVAPRLEGPAARQVPGTVVQADCRSHQGRHGSFPICRLAVDYAVFGKTHRLERVLYEPLFQAGERVTVIYNADHPAIASVREHDLFANEMSHAAEVRVGVYTCFALALGLGMMAAAVWWLV